MIFDLQKLRERQGREAAMAATEARRRANLARCLDEWRNYALRRHPLRPAEGREIIQDQVLSAPPPPPPPPPRNVRGYIPKPPPPPAPVAEIGDSSNIVGYLLLFMIVALLVAGALVGVAIVLWEAA